MSSKTNGLGMKIKTTVERPVEASVRIIGKRVYYATVQEAIDWADPQPLNLCKGHRAVGPAMPIGLPSSGWGPGRTM